MRDYAKEYYSNLKRLIDNVQVRDINGTDSDFCNGIEGACNLIVSGFKNNGHKVMIIGNGASAAISSHMSTDFWKNGGMRAVAFNDSSLLTCVGNDYGYEQIFQKPIEMFANVGDTLIAISSSGSSENILRGVKAAREKQCKVITLSGFNKENRLSKTGEINFYVPESSYGPVEILHHSICHCILDTLLRLKNRSL